MPDSSDDDYVDYVNAKLAWLRKIELVRTSDLHLVHWLPTPVTAPGQVLMWDSDTTFIVRGDVFQRCDVTGKCIQLAIQDGGQPVLVAGG